MRRGGVFNVKIDYDDENIVRKRANGIKGVKRIMRDLERKFQ